MTDSAVRLIALGVGNAFSAKHYTTGFAFGSGDDWVLIDCPHPIRKMVREGSIRSGIPLDLDRIYGVVLSHLHADHCSGLEDYSYYSRYLLNRKAKLAIHPEVSTKLWTGLLSAGMGEVRGVPGVPAATRRLDDFIDSTLLNETSTTEFGPFSIECRPTIHSVPTTAFRIKYAGRTLGFSADSAFDPGLIEWLSNADLIVHEGTDNLEATTVHTHIDSLAKLPKSLRSKMLLTHYPDHFEGAAGGIDLLIEGRAYPV